MSPAAEFEGVNAPAAALHTTQSPQKVSDAANNTGMSAAAVEAPSRTEQRRIVRDLNRSDELREGDEYYILSTTWYNKWKKWVSYDTEPESDGHSDSGDGQPGPIANASLLRSNAGTPVKYTDGFYILREGCFELLDYMLVNKELWDSLSSWYGGGPAVSRRAFCNTDGIVTVEPYPQRIRLAIYSRPNNQTDHRILYVARNARLRTLVDEVYRATNPENRSAFRLFRRDASLKGVMLKIFEHDASEAEDAELEDAYQQSVANEWSQDRVQETLEKELEAGKVADCIPETASFLVVEFQEPSGTWPCDSDPQYYTRELPSRKSTNGQTSDSSSDDEPPRVAKTRSAFDISASNEPLEDMYRSGKKKVPGTSGLQNLGNTCFMNSMLQCLSNNPSLTYYFVKGLYREHINANNPLGMGGRVARSYAALLKTMWVENCPSYVSPMNFKHTLGQFAPQFSGYQQHDSQEFLAFLLDGLHEDVNHVVDKPVTEPVESDGKKDDRMVAREAWEAHLKRNQSVIVEYFQGQLKSTLVCPDCHKTSVTFDPYMYLSVPIPRDDSRKMPVVVIELESLLPELTDTDEKYEQRRIKYAMKINAQASISEFKDAVIRMHLANISGRQTDSEGNEWNPDDFQSMVCDIYHNDVYKIFWNSEGIDSIRDTDIAYVYVQRRRNDIETEDGTIVPGKTAEAMATDAEETGGKSDDDAGDVVMADADDRDAQSEYGSYGMGGLFGSLNSVHSDAKGKDVRRVFESVKIVHAYSARSSLPQDIFLPYVKALHCRTNGILLHCEILTLLIPILRTLSAPNLSPLLDELELALSPISPHTLSTMYTEVDDVKKRRRSDSSSKSQDDDPMISENETDNKGENEEESKGETEGGESEGESGRKSESDRMAIDSIDGEDDRRAIDEREGFGRKKIVLDRRLDAVRMLFEEGPEGDESDGDVEEQGQEAWSTLRRLISQLVPRTHVDSHDGVNVTRAFEPLFRLSVGGGGFSTGGGSYYNSSSYYSHSREESVDFSLEEVVLKRNTSSYSSNPRPHLTVHWNTQLLSSLFSSPTTIAHIRHISGHQSLSLLGGGRERERERGIGLYECLEVFSRREVLSKEDTWYCGECKDHVQASKKMDLWSAPKFLVVHLKRFQYSRFSGRRDKIEDYVDFPITGLDLSKYVLEMEGERERESGGRPPPLYDLYAVSNHYGGLGGGHYTAFAKNFLDSQWYRFDDSFVQRVSVEDVKTEAAYVLHYERRDVELESEKKWLEKVADEIRVPQK